MIIVKKSKILGAAGIPKEMVERLEQEIGPVEVLSSDIEKNRKSYSDKQVFVVRSKPKVTLTLFRYPQLKVIATGSGNGQHRPQSL